MAKIKLKDSVFAIVDDEDFDFLNQWKWHLLGKKSRYAFRNVVIDGKRKKILMHRFVNKTPEGFETDHINHNSLDNRKSNLRTVTKSQNQQSRRRNKKGSSKYKGVYWHKQHKKWCASIQVNKSRKHLGLFSSQEDAALAYQSATN